MKLLNIDLQVKQDMLTEFAKYLNSLKNEPLSKISFEKKIEESIKKDIIKPKVYYTSLAYWKLKTLVDQCSTELGWHGTVQRLENNVFIIEDIYVYPQTVTGTTVTADAEEYAKWKMALSDEQYNSLRYFGHSHVNMSCFASGTDLTLQQDYLKTLPDKEFYIFTIDNKRGERDIVIYDLANNILFEKADIEVAIITDGIDIDAWAKKQIKDMLKEPAKTTASIVTGGVTTSRANNYYDSRYAGYEDYYDDEEIERLANIHNQNKANSIKQIMIEQFQNQFGRRLN